MVYGNAKVYDNAKVCGNAAVYDNAEVCGDANVFSARHLFCVSPVGKDANSLTAFRTKNREMDISFSYSLYTVNAFKKMVNEWDPEYKDIALAAVELAQKHIDLSPENAEE